MLQPSREIFYVSKIREERIYREFKAHYGVFSLYPISQLNSSLPLNVFNFPHFVYLSSLTNIEFYQKI